MMDDDSTRQKGKGRKRRRRKRRANGTHDTTAWLLFSSSWFSATTKS
jgi:hypothetical protein